MDGQRVEMGRGGGGGTKTYKEMCPLGWIYIGCCAVCCRILRRVQGRHYSGRLNFCLNAGGSTSCLIFLRVNRSARKIVVVRSPLFSQTFVWEEGPEPAF